MSADCKNKCPDCYMKRIVIYNEQKNKYFQPHCKTYTCPEHGWKKKKDLEKGIEKWLSQFGVIRFLTFTVKFNKNDDLDLHNFKVQKAWHRFITELRRNKIFTERERNLQYVKVYEYHKSGALHLHVLSSEYVHWIKLQAVWQSALSLFFDGKGKLGNVNAKGIKSAKAGAKYVAKYVVKMAEMRKKRIRSWSKSGKVSIFPKKEKQKGWMIIRKDTIEYSLVRLGIPILELSSVNVTNSNRKKAPPLFSAFSDYEYYSPDDNFIRFLNEQSKN